MNTEINGKMYKIPESWDDLSFWEFASLVKLQSYGGLDLITFLSVITLIPIDTLKLSKVNAEVLNTLNKLLFGQSNYQQMSWHQILTLPPRVRLHNRIIEIPSFIKLSYHGQVRDISQAIERNDPLSLIDEYPLLCSIYCQGLIYNEYVPDRAICEREDFSNAPWQDIIPLGNSIIKFVLTCNSINLN
jgi:hypothetical protein